MPPYITIRVPDTFPIVASGSGTMLRKAAWILHKLTDHPNSVCEDIIKNRPGQEQQYFITRNLDNIDEFVNELADLDIEVDYVVDFGDVLKAENTGGTTSFGYTFIDKQTTTPVVEPYIASNVRSLLIQAAICALQDGNFDLARDITDSLIQHEPR